MSTRTGNDALMLRLVRKVGDKLHRASSHALVIRGLKRAGVAGAPRIFTYTKPNELEALYRLALKCPEGSAALELGAHLGASTCYLGAGLHERSGTLFSVDTWNNETMPEGQQDTYSQFRMNTKGLGATVVPVRKRSTDLSLADVRTPLVLAFIDADHSYEAVKADFETIRPWLSPVAVIAFHDTVAFEGVSRFLGELLASGQFLLDGHIGNLTWIRRVASDR